MVMSNNKDIQRTGFCRICKVETTTDWHHIISKHRCVTIGRQDLLDDPGNLVELCEECHEHTSASLIRALLIEDESKRYGGRVKSAGWKVKCFRCGRVTHTADKCKEEKDVAGLPLVKDGAMNQWLVRRNGVNCFRCGRFGHKWRECDAKRHIDGRPLIAGASS